MNNKNKVVDIILDILIGVLSVLCVILIVLRIFFIKVVVNGSSMTPTILDESKGYMLKVNENTKIERFDVVASEYNSKDDYYIIKRVLGLPGETVKLYDNVLYVNGEVVDQPFTFNKRDVNFSTTEWTLGENEYLLVGDNRPGTIPPKVVTKDELLSLNGFCYDFDGEKGWYFFKDGK